MSVITGYADGAKERFIIRISSDISADPFPEKEEGGIILLIFFSDRGIANLLFSNNKII